MADKDPIDLLTRARDLLRAVHPHINPKAVDMVAAQTQPVEDCYRNTQARLLADEISAELARAEAQTRQSETQIFYTNPNMTMRDPRDYDQSYESPPVVPEVKP